MNCKYKCKVIIEYWDCSQHISPDGWIKMEWKQFFSDWHGAAGPRLKAFKSTFTERKTNIGANLLLASLLCQQQLEVLRGVPVNIAFKMPE